jgi:polyisoprenoid-binding protein YceI
MLICWREISLTLIRHDYCLSFTQILDMKQSIFLLSLMTIVSTTMFGQAYTPTDNGSKVSFVIKNFGVKTNGVFTGLSGMINFDPANATKGSIDVSLDANSVNTSNKSRDGHLRKDEYFDVAKYPRISFKTSKITATNKAGYWYAFGTLTIKGVAKEISFPFTAKPQTGGYLFTGSFSINRRDFKVGGKSLVMGDNVDVTLSVFAKKN